MAIVRHFGKPTLFVTFTVNPNWVEIQHELLPDQSVNDRPDLVARVFQLKKKALLLDLQTIFGRYQGSVWTIEYQKQGLPHMHLLLFLHTEDHFLDQERIDQVVRAELPDPAMDPDGTLTEIVKSQLTHGPYGAHDPKAPCMVDASDGSGQEDGYPLYQRRQDGRAWVKRVHRVDVVMDNSWIVPHNPYLTRRYAAHINVEVCASVQAVKYIHKYIYKGGDRSTVQIQLDNDEVSRHINGRYIGPSQACWHIFEFSAHGETPPVLALQIHLPGQQPVRFPDNPTTQELLDAQESAQITLTAFFTYNQLHADGRQYLYNEFPAHYVYHKAKSKRYWTPHTRGFSIGQMYHCSPIAGEKFYLRLLLTIVRGPKSYEDLCTVDGQLCQSFQAACFALGLLEDDREWVSCFTEAVLFTSGTALRTLLVTSLVHGGVTDPNSLWNRFRANICDDLPHCLQSFAGVPVEFEDPHYDYGLFLINALLTDFDKTLASYQLSQYTLDWGRLQGNPLIQAELQYAPDTEQALRDEKYQQFNADQQQAFNTIVAAIEQDPASAHFFLQGPASTGKTFLYQCLCHHFCAKGEIVLCVASSGIAALLLPGGQTSHSCFKIPLQCNRTSTCNINRSSLLADLIRRTALIIWDEVPMQHKYNFTAVNFTLCDLQNQDVLFGGIPTVLGGDFAQILPVVRKGNRASTVEANLQRSVLWSQFRILTLKQNMRVCPDPANQAFTAWLAELPYDSQQYGPIQLPPQVLHRFHDLKSFCSNVFPPEQLAQAHVNSEFFRSCAVLTLRNDTVVELNSHILEGMQGETHTFDSTDSADVNEAEADVHELPAEFLQSLNPACLPPSHLCLKLGAPVILLR
ncbi:MAG: hypothetical protein FRX48_04810 [Lasallia pustulata]|uniref:ATP-dependent DNA helicase n=1 Tax=Lasallia pustulata TaxID=136370 RepID=A0A5M8PPV5_9LECA|nr:MAG: hypothetical protein FRX48_04810 [Lasallia pustulata]